MSENNEFQDDDINDLRKEDEFYHHWCEECGYNVWLSCARHAVIQVKDKRIQTYAMQTLPHVLTVQILPQLGTKESPVCGIFAKKPVMTRTQFGPLEAPYSLVNPHHGDGKPVLKLFNPEGTDLFLNLSDENRCNWMMFVRMAHSKGDSNAVIHQHKGGLYFLATKNIAPREELRIWFSEPYLKKMSTVEDSPAYKPPAIEHPLPEGDWKPFDEFEIKQEKHSGLPSMEKLVIKDTVNDEKTDTKQVKKTKRCRKIATRPRQSHAPIDCPTCGLTFTAKRKFEYHQLVHTGERPYPCPICKKAFATKFKLERHLFIHKEGTREFKCTLCGSGFNRKDHLKNHMKIHDPNKEVYKCQDCPKTYATHFSFKIHCGYHQADKGNYNCTCCTQTFEDKDIYILHLKKHAGFQSIKGEENKRHICEVCGKKFHTPKDIKRHMLTHTGEKSFLCDICSVKFARRDHLVRHVRLTHDSNRQPRKRVPALKKLALLKEKSTTAASKSEELVKIDPKSLTLKVQNVTNNQVSKAQTLWSNYIATVLQTSTGQSIVQPTATSSIAQAAKPDVWSSVSNQNLNNLQSDNQNNAYIFDSLNSIPVTVQCVVFESANSTPVTVSATTTQNVLNHVKQHVPLQLPTNIIVNTKKENVDNQQEVE